MSTTVNLNTALNAAQRGWGPGWPNCDTDKWLPLEVVSLDGRLIRFPAHHILAKEGRLVFEEDVSFPGGVREEILELVTLLLHESEVRGYINLQPGWCWGGACRPVKRSDGTLTDVPSNHSWALALDINAPENVFGGTSHTIGPDMVRLWNEYGFRWGGIYRDYMHFEFMGTPADARAMTEKARRELRGGEDMRVEDLIRGHRAYREKFKERGEDPGDPPKDRPEDFKEGWRQARFAATNPRESTA